MRELASVIRNQIANCLIMRGRRSLLDDYGKVLYRAWHATEGLCRYEVEETMIQVVPAPWEMWA